MFTNVIERQALGALGNVVPINYVGGKVIGSESVFL